MGLINGIFVLADGTRLVTTAEHTLLLIAPSGRLATIAGEDAEEDEDEEEDENENMTGGFLDARGSSKQSSWAVGAVSTKSSQNEGARARGLEAVGTTVTIPGMGLLNGVFVLADGTRLVTTDEHTLLQIPPSGRLATVAGTATAAQDEAEDESAKWISGRNRHPRPLPRSIWPYRGQSRQRSGSGW